MSGYNSMNQGDTAKRVVVTTNRVPGVGTAAGTTLCKECDHYAYKNELCFLHWFKQAKFLS
uniref:Uncharacterized protein n=1 Tax=viral metagenome TaxID=1070528 RepID=A0A6M3JYK5_9ZZZZ